MLPPATRNLLQFIDASPTPFHAVAEAARRLEESGFTRLREEDAWTVTPGARHYVTRNGSTLIAFVVGSGAPAEHGFRLVGGTRRHDLAVRRDRFELSAPQVINDLSDFRRCRNHVDLPIRSRVLNIVEPAEV